MMLHGLLLWSFIPLCSEDVCATSPRAPGKGLDEDRILWGLSAAVPREVSGGNSVACHLIISPRAKCLKCLLVLLRKLILKGLIDLLTQPRTYGGTTHPSIHLSFHHLSIFLSVCLPIQLSIHLFMPLSVYLSTCPSIHYFVYLSV